jgi:hypothetical protein
VNRAISSQDVASILASQGRSQQVYPFNKTRTIFKMPALIASGKSGQAATMAQERRFSDVPRVRVKNYPPVILAYNKAPAAGRVSRWERSRGNLIDLVATGCSASQNLGHPADTVGIRNHLAVAIDYPEKALDRGAHCRCSLLE